MSLNIKSPYKGFGTFDSLGRRDESELGIVTIRGFNLHKQLVQAVTREAGHLKLAGRNYFVSTSLADMGHCDVTRDRCDQCAVIVRLTRNHFLAHRIPQSVGLYMGTLCTLLLIHISNNIMSFATATAVSGWGRGLGAEATHPIFHFFALWLTFHQHI